MTKRIYSLFLLFLIFKLSAQTIPFERIEIPQDEAYKKGNAYIDYFSRDVEQCKKHIGKKVVLTNAAAFQPMTSLKLRKDKSIKKETTLYYSDKLALVGQTFIIDTVLQKGTFDHTFIILQSSSNAQKVYSCELSYFDIDKTPLFFCDFIDYLKDRYLHKELILRRSWDRKRDEVYLCDSIDFYSGYLYKTIRLKVNGRYKYYPYTGNYSLAENKSIGADFIRYDFYINNQRAFNDFYKGKKFYYIGGKSIIENFEIPYGKELTFRQLSLVNMKESYAFHDSEADSIVRTSYVSDKLFMTDSLYQTKIDSIKSLLSDAVYVCQRFRQNVKPGDQFTVKEIIYHPLNPLILMTDQQRTIPVEVNLSFSSLCLKDFLTLEQHLEKEKQEKNAKAERLKSLTKKYGSKYAHLIMDGYYAIGMSKEMVQLVMGYPKKINQSVGSWGSREQWVYDLGTYLYFDGDRLDSFQSSN